MERFGVFVLFLSCIHFSKGQDVCEDLLGNCDDYRSVVCEYYVDWAKENCAKYCKFCNATVVTTGPVLVERCPYGWHLSEPDKTCFKKFGTDKASRATWYTAKRECERSGATLVMIKDGNKNSLVAETLGSALDYWMGLKNLGDGVGITEFQYADMTMMSSASYSHWDANQPNNFDNKQHCVTVRSTGRWKDRPCLQHKPFVCEKKLAGRLPGWTHVDDGSCFKIFGIADENFRMTWYSAGRECKKHGGTLVTIKDGNKNRVVTEALNYENVYWIGLRNMGNETHAKFQYSDKSWMSTTSYINWNSGQPDNLNDKQHCVTLLQTNGKWSDNGCLGKYPFICQIESGGC